MNHKVILCGNSSVGKTCLSKVISNKEMDPNAGPTTGSGFDYTVLTHNGQQVTVNIWDTAGQETYRSMIRIYFYGSDIALVCFDITSRDSFKELPDWFKLIDENCRGVRPCGIVVANKADLLEQREVSDEEIQKFAEEYASDWIAVSAISKQNIAELQDKIAELLIQKKEDQKFKPFRLPTDPIPEQPKETEKREDTSQNKEENVVQNEQIEHKEQNEEQKAQNEEKEPVIVDITKPLNQQEKEETAKRGGCSC